MNSVHQMMCVDKKDELFECVATREEINKCLYLVKFSF